MTQRAKSSGRGLDAMVSVLWPLTVWLAYEAGYRDGERIGYIRGLAAGVRSAFRTAAGL